MADDSGSVIDWKKALEKCGDDEEFLKELLGDLRTEANEHKAAIDGAATQPMDYATIKKEASLAASAASSILCTQLTDSAHKLVEAAAASNSDSIQGRLEEFHKALAAFEDYLENKLGI